MNRVGVGLGDKILTVIGQCLDIVGHLALDPLRFHTTEESCDCLPHQLRSAHASLPGDSIETFEQGVRKGNVNIRSSFHTNILVIIQIRIQKILQRR